MSYDGIKSSDAKRARLLELLPSFGWSIVNAGIAAGYSKTYANTTLARSIKKDARFCQAILDKRRSFEATSTDLKEDVVRRLSETIRKPDLRPVELARLSEVLGRIQGWMSETRILETSDRQRALTEAEAEEARRLAVASIAPSIGLPDLSPGPNPVIPDGIEPLTVVDAPLTLDGDDQTATDTGDKADINDTKTAEQETRDGALGAETAGGNNL